MSSSPEVAGRQASSHVLQMQRFALRSRRLALRPCNARGNRGAASVRHSRCRGPTVAGRRALAPTQALSLACLKIGFSVWRSRPASAAVMLNSPFLVKFKKSWPGVLARVPFLGFLSPRSGLVSMAPASPDAGGHKSEPWARGRHDGSHTPSAESGFSAVNVPLGCLTKVSHAN